MNLNELKDKLYDVSASFFAGASVIWSEQDGTKPKPPYVMLSTRNLTKNTFPIVADDGKRYYQCSTALEVNLYTNGEPIKVDENETVYADTAMSDMAEFMLYIESEGMTEKLAADDISIMFVPPIRNLSKLENNGQYRFRSMLEAVVSFVMEADGMYGIGSMPVVPNYSGGGSEELASAEMAEIEGVEISEES